MISLTHIHKSYDMGGKPFQALNDVSLEIGSGEYLAITGPSGSGKSTLLNMIGLLDRPDQGHYQLAGQLTEHLDEEQRALLRRENIGFIFQSFHLLPRLSAYENIALPLMLAEVPRPERQPRIEKVLEQVGLADHAHKRPNQLSGGQMQRVAIARAIVMNPKVLLADEPTGNLDQASGIGVIQLLEQLNQAGMTLLMVTHDPALASRSQRQLHLVDGSIVNDSGTARG